MSEVSNKRFVHFDGTKQEFIDGGYPNQYQESIVFINGDGNESNNTIYTHGEYYGQGVIVEGDASNSAVLKNGDNKTLSEFSVSLGSNCISGLKGWYYKAIQFNNTTKTTFLYLTKTQQIPVIITTAIGYDCELDVPFSLTTGTIISVVNDAKYDNKYKISAVDKQYGRVGLKSVDDANPFPFLDVITDTDLLNGIFSPEDYAFYALDYPDRGIYDMGQNALSIGDYNRATNNSAIALGYNNHAYGKFSICEGRDNKAGYAAHAEGRGSKATGELSHAEGLSTIAYANISHTEGRDTETYGEVSHAEGLLGKTYGLASHVEGGYCKSYGDYSHCEGYNTQVKENASASHTEGYNCVTGGYYTSNTLITGTNNNNGAYSHAEGNATISCGIGSHSEGKATLATGEASHAEGCKTIAQGKYSHTEGYNTITSGAYSHTEGCNNTNAGKYSHVNGYNNTISSPAECIFITGSNNVQKTCLGYYVKAYCDSFYNGDVEVQLNTLWLSNDNTPIKSPKYIFNENDLEEVKLSEEPVDFSYIVNDYIYFCYPNSPDFRILKISSIDKNKGTITYSSSTFVENFEDIFPNREYTYVFKTTRQSGHNLYLTDNSAVFGSNNIIAHNDQFICGTYNKDSNALFLVGNGDSEDRSNALEIYSDKIIPNVATYFDNNVYFNGFKYMHMPLIIWNDDTKVVPYKRYIIKGNETATFEIYPQETGEEYFILWEIYNAWNGVSIRVNDEHVPINWANGIDYSYNVPEGAGWVEVALLYTENELFGTQCFYKNI